MVSIDGAPLVERSRRRPICADCGVVGDNSVSNWRTSPVLWGAGIRWRFVENRLGRSEVRHEVVGRTFSRSVDPVVEESWFPATRPGHHISARAQEYLLHEGCTEDARVALLETVFVLIALQQGRASRVPARRADHIAPRGSARPLPSSLPASCWEQLHEVKLEEWFLRRVPTLKKCQHFMRGRLRHCFAVALRERYRVKGAQHSRAEERAWKLFGLVPVMLLHRPRGTGSVGKDELVSRAADFVRGRWIDLLDNIHDTSGQPRPAMGEIQEHERRGRAALGRVRQGQVSCARQSSLAQIWHQRLWRRLHSCKREGRKKGSGRFLKKSWNLFSGTGFQVVHQVPPECTVKLRPRPGGCTNEMLRTCLCDPEVFQLLFREAEDCASASVAEKIRKAFISASMTALQKPDGGVRGIATGTSFRRLVARTLARQFGKRSKQLAPPSNLLCHREPAQIASDTQSGQSHTRTPCARCCPSMALVLTTMCTEAPCCKGCFRSSELHMPTPRVTFGKMRLGCNTASSKRKGANKATLWCHCCSVWRSMTYCNRPRGSSEQMRTFSLSWTTSISRPQPRTALAQRITASERSGMLTQASNFTQGRRACGIGRRVPGGDG